jgi:hypothetical protein
MKNILSVARSYCKKPFAVFLIGVVVGGVCCMIMLHLLRPFHYSLGRMHTPPQLGHLISTSSEMQGKSPFVDPVVEKNKLMRKRYWCDPSDSTVSWTDCQIEKFEEAQKERVWKQRKFEQLSVATINKWEHSGSIVEQEQAVARWRAGFDAGRDSWCELSEAFHFGSKSQGNIYYCKTDFEVRAIAELNELYQYYILDPYSKNSIEGFDDYQ